VTAVCAAVAIAATTAAAGHPAGRAVGRGPRVSPAVEVSRGCQGSNAETEQAVEYPYVYVTWIGCGGIGFARSADGGRSFGHPLRLPGSAPSGCGCNPQSAAGWDPAIAVAPDGTIYVSYMINRQGYAHPRIAVSYDGGKTFARLFSAMPPARYKNNWGDRDFIAVSADGTIYLTWVYGRHLPTKPSTPFVSNAVIQKSADGGRTWDRITPVSPGFPRHGDVSAAPLLVAPGGRIDVLMWAGSSLRHSALPLHNDYFTSSTDSGRTWSRAVPVAPAAGHIGRLVTWIDANIGIDAAGTLYATWDTQQPGGDIGWLSYSTDHGRTWSPARRATPGHDTAEHIMAVAGGRPGIAYVASLKGGPFLTARSPRRFSLYLRVFSVHRGWLSSPIRVSRTYGNRHGWPGDTIGISVLPGHRVMLSWGIPGSIATGQIWATQVQHAARGFLPTQQQSRASLGSGPASARRAPRL